MVMPFSFWETSANSSIHIGGTLLPMRINTLKAMRQPVKGVRRRMKKGRILSATNGHHGPMKQQNEQGISNFRRRPGEPVCRQRGGGRCSSCVSVPLRGGAPRAHADEWWTRVDFDLLVLPPLPGRSELLEPDRCVFDGRLRSQALARSLPGLSGATGQGSWPLPSRGGFVASVLGGRWEATDGVMVDYFQVSFLAYPIWTYTNGGWSFCRS